MQLSKSLRSALFAFVCIPLRIAIAHAAASATATNRYMVSTPLLFIGTCMLYLHATNSRMQAPEGGGYTWWANFRVIHGLLYILAAIALFINRKRTSSLLLSTDAALGIVFWVLYSSRTTQWAST